MTVKRYDDCTGRFSSYFFSGRSQICRLCVIRRRMEEKLKEQYDKLTVCNNKIDELTRTVDSLKELLQRIYGASEGHGGISSTATRPPSPFSSENNCASSHSDTGFTNVRRGAKPVRHVIHPTICSNRFQIFGRRGGAC